MPPYPANMNFKLTDLFIAEMEREGKGTRRALGNVPEGKGDWKPHAKSFNLGQLATLTSRMPSWIDMIINMNEPPSLLRNDCSTKNNWLKVKCIGTKSNRSAIGVRVRVVTGRHSQINEVMSGSSYISQNDLRLHFGLGQAKQADLVEVRWPLGLVESFKSIEANQLLVLQEGHGILRREKFGNRKVESSKKG